MKLSKFRCWWCQELRPKREHHHEVKTPNGRPRRTCSPCYEDKESVYWQIYDGEDAELVEVTKRVRESERLRVRE